ncbi:amino acid adenylation domain-containing protein [Micromonospora sp. CA-259024]|uniref:non-ribosomal peptide synthetase n=1 Tax=Micromonospora sp. CA-259024 TaxID=3239965 RepID=UPI003D9372F2
MALELLAELRRLDIRLRLTDGRLEVIAPAGALTPGLRDRLRADRDDLIALLAGAGDGPDRTLTAHPEDRFEPFPLTDLQHAYRVGRGSAVELGGVSSHYYFELERTGLDPDRLTTALRKVIARHDMLRMTIRPDGRQQVLAEVPEYEIAVADLADLPAEMRDKELARLRTEMDHQVLPSDRWPLFDIRASLLGGGRIRLHVSLDVLILDGFSLYLLFGEWRRFYEDPDWQPAPIGLSCRDYVLHEEAARGSEAYARDERYWLDRLDSLPPAPALPLAVQPAQLTRTEFTRRAARLSRDRWAALTAGARQRGLTPSAVLMTAFAEVLRRWSGQTDLTLNLTLFNRPPVHPEINSVVGDFTSVSLLAVPARMDEGFTGRVQDVQSRLLRDMEHLSYSGVRVLRERSRRLGAGPGAAMPVVFTSALVLGAPGADPAQGIRFFGDEVYAITQTPQVWLDHQVSEEAGELVWNWDAVEALFPAGVLDDMFAAYRAMLDRLTTDPAAWDCTDLTELPAGQAAERAAANRTTTPLPVRTLPDLVEERAAAQPDAVAVITSDGEISYAETVARARRLARRLRELGAARDTLVAVVLDKGLDQVPAVLGVTLSGAAYLPIDAHWPQARRHRLLDQGAVRVVVTSPQLRDELTWPVGVRVVTPADPEVTGASEAPLADGPAPDDLAYVIFTSGSTGEPKGVMIDHRAAANTVQDINQRFRIGPDDRTLALAALSFDLSVYDVFGLLAAGGAVVMPDPHGVHDPAHWTDLVVRHRVTVWNSVPALQQVWADHHGDGPVPGARLRLTLLSGDWIPVGLPGRVRALHPGIEVISLGGATEASIWSIVYPIGEVPADWTRIPYGKPLANQTMHVHDATLEPCPVWTVGEIYIGGAGVARGYWADPERTAERFLVHPRTGERLYRTGDMGRYLPGGDIEFLGRQDSQVKINGYRIELGEITAALRRDPGVAEAVVDVDVNPATGRRQLVAHVVPASGDTAASGPAVDRLAVWRHVRDSGDSELRRGLADLDAELTGYRKLWHAVEGLAPAVMARTLAALGAAGRTDAGEIIERHGLKPGYRGLLAQWLRVLADRGRLGETDVAALDEEVRHGLAGLRPDGQEALVGYLTSCVANQVEMLRGEVSPLELLLPGGDPRITDALYAGNPVSHLQNRVTARVVRALVDKAPAGRAVRILEVGAGTGATTTQVLRGLPVTRVHYRFTDVSTYFTERAKPRFRSYPFVDYGVFDIDQPPGGQGVSPGSVDVVIAANVLHDARDLGRSLRHLRSVLAPGGVLVLVEGTANSLVQMISVGFIEGLGSHQGQRELPLLTVPEWAEQVTAAGFARFAAVPDGPAAVDAHEQHVLLAAAPEDQADVDPVRLRESLEEVLPDYMVPRHLMVVDRLPLSANGKVDRSALPSPWESAAVEERVAPRDDVERRLVAIWRDALGHDDFGVEDNFFELGGDSLHAVKILDRLRAEFGVDSGADEGLEMLFDSPTVAELARLLRERAGA